MKIFTKLFFGVLLILTVAMSTVRYITVRGMFEKELDSAVESALVQHRMVSYSVLGNIIIYSASEVRGADHKVSEDILEVIEKLISGNTGTPSTITEVRDYDGGTAGMDYTVSGVSGSETIEVESVVSAGDRFYLVKTLHDVSGIYANTASLSKRYNMVYLIADAVCAVIVFMLALSVTGPVSRLSRASREMAAGNYDVKIPSSRHDEIGELSRSFVRMKDSVTDTMDQLEMASKQKDDFVGNFAHELKTPMTSIIGYADVIYSGNLTENEMREAAGYILNEGMRLETLSFKLLELITVKENSFVLEDTDAGVFFDDTEQTVIPVAVKKDMRIRFDCESAYIKIEYDLLKTMVMNLIDNAFKSGGTSVQVTGKAEGDRYHISIRDNGRGIPEDEISRITEAFYMIDKARSRRENGAGLGLALCERVARLHGTALAFGSKVGEGTCVSFDVALSEEAPDDEGD